MKTTNRILIVGMLGTFLLCIQSCQPKEPSIDDMASYMRQYAERINPKLKGKPIRISWGLGVADTPESCACLKVCDGNGNNCTPCSCDPDGCGTCD